MLVMLFSRIFQWFQIFPNYNFSFQFWILSNFWIFFPIFVIFFSIFQFFNFGPISILSILSIFRICQFSDFLSNLQFFEISNFCPIFHCVNFFYYLTFQFCPFFQSNFYFSRFFNFVQFPISSIQFLFFYNFQVCPFLFNFDHIVSKSKLKINSCFKK